MASYAFSESSEMSFTTSGATANAKGDLNELLCYIANTLFVFLFFFAPLCFLFKNEKRAWERGWHQPEA